MRRTVRRPCQISTETPFILLVTPGCICSLAVTPSSGTRRCWNEPGELRSPRWKAAGPGYCGVCCLPECSVCAACILLFPSLRRLIRVAVTATANRGPSQPRSKHLHCVLAFLLVAIAHRHHRLCACPQLTVRDVHRSSSTSRATTASRGTSPARNTGDSTRHALPLLVASDCCLRQGRGPLDAGRGLQQGPSHDDGIPARAYAQLSVWGGATGSLTRAASRSALLLTALQWPAAPCCRLRAPCCQMPPPQLFSPQAPAR